MNIFILDKNYNQIGMLSNEGANPQAPYFDDLYTQELDTGADTFYFTTLSTRASRDFIEIGNHIIFQFNNRHRLFAISDLEFEHKEGRNVIGVYAEGVGFQLLETFMGEFEGGDDTNGDGKVDKEDEGEGEFMTYDMFLEKVLKDTDWNYQIMSGDLTNINMGKEVTFQNGKNIYALLQDSMQEFGGIELEFRAEYAGGSLNKTIYAYPHKGRGSFVGQRFEYGHNVAGIKKKQEIIDGLDENIILYEGLETVDGLNVEVTYEVDFALRSHEVEELEIGDTHYVIDNDFEPAQFEARIGKIEISFSDPTKNKCYIANFKKISGSKPDNIDSDNVEDIIEDNLDDKLDELIDDKLDELIGDGFKNHTHNKLVSTGGTKKVICDDDGWLVPGTDNEYFLGSSSRRWAMGFIDNIRAATLSSQIAVTDNISSSAAYSYIYEVPFLGTEMNGASQITDSSNVTKQDLLDFILNDVNIHKYIAKGLESIDDINYEPYLGLLSKDYDLASKVAQLIMRKSSSGGYYNCYNLPALVTTLIGAFQQHVENGGEDGSNVDLSAYATKTYVDDAIDDIELTPGPKGDKGEDGVSVTNVAINSSNHLITTLSNNRTIDAGALPSGSGGSSSSLDNYIKYVSGDSSDYPNPPYDHLETKVALRCKGDLFIDQGLWINHYYSDAHATVIDEGLVSADIIHARTELRLDAYDNKASLTTISLVKDSNGTKKTISAIDLFDAVEAHTSFRDSHDKVLDTTYLKVWKIQGQIPATGERMKYVEFEDAICVKQIFAPEGNVSWLGDLSIEGGIFASSDIEIGGAIVFPDGSRLTSANSVATVNEDLLEEQQNTIQQQQETIASLEARIARLEEMLGINN